MSVYLRGTCKRAHGHSGECKHYHFSFRLNGKRYRGSILKRERSDKQNAELRIRQEVFEGRFGKAEIRTMKFGDFVDQAYLPCDGEFEECVAG